MVLVKEEGSVKMQLAESYIILRAGRLYILEEIESIRLSPIHDTMTWIGRELDVTECDNFQDQLPSHGFSIVLLIIVVRWKSRFKN